MRQRLASGAHGTEHDHRVGAAGCPATKTDPHWNQALGLPEGQQFISGPKCRAHVIQATCAGRLQRLQQHSPAQALATRLGMYGNADDAQAVLFRGHSQPTVSGQGFREHMPHWAGATTQA